MSPVSVVMIWRHFSLPSSPASTFIQEMVPVREVILRMLGSVVGEGEGREVVGVGRVLGVVSERAP